MHNLHNAAYEFFDVTDYWVIICDKTKSEKELLRMHAYVVTH